MTEDAPILTIKELFPTIDGKRVAALLGDPDFKSWLDTKKKEDEWIAKLSKGESPDQTTGDDLTAKRVALAEQLGIIEYQSVDKKGKWTQAEVLAATQCVSGQAKLE